MKFRRRHEDRTAVGWSGLPPSRRLSVFLLCAALAIFALPTFGTAQAPRRANQGLQAVARALIEGRYDDVDALADKLDTKDPAVVALKSSQTALQTDAKYAPALLGPARAIGDKTPPQAMALARRALEINPSLVD